MSNCRPPRVSLSNRSHPAPRLRPPARLPTAGPRPRALLAPPRPLIQPLPMHVDTLLPGLEPHRRPARLHDGRVNLSAPAPARVQHLPVPALVDRLFACTASASRPFSAGQVDFKRTRSATHRATTSALCVAAPTAASTAGVADEMLVSVQPGASALTRIRRCCCGCWSCCWSCCSTARFGSSARMKPRTPCLAAV